MYWLIAPKDLEYLVENPIRWVNPCIDLTVQLKDRWSRPAIARHVYDIGNNVNQLIRRSPTHEMCVNITMFLNSFALEDRTLVCEMCCVAWLKYDHIIDNLVIDIKNDFDYNGRVLKPYHTSVFFLLAYFGYGKHRGVTKMFKNFPVTEFL